MNDLVTRIATRYKAATSPILKIIVQKLLDDRDVTSLLEAYNTELSEDWSDAHDGDRMPPDLFQNEANQWEEENLGILHSAREIEVEFQNAYIPAYRKAVPWATRQTALEVMDLPSGLDVGRTGVARDVIRATALVLAQQDAVDAHALREMAMERRGLAG